MKRFSGVLVAAPILAALASGCGTASESVRTRAPYDLRCDSSQVAIYEIGNHTFEARGCDRRAVYTCTFNNRGED
jgi:hypothetical protein